MISSFRQCGASYPYLSNQKSRARVMCCAGSLESKPRSLVPVQRLHRQANACIRASTCVSFPPCDHLSRRPRQRTKARCSKLSSRIAPRVAMSASSHRNGEEGPFTASPTRQVATRLAHGAFASISISMTATIHDSAIFRHSLPQFWSRSAVPRNCRNLLGRWTASRL
ncbi:hypothetical protein BDW22DRAFT_333757 [Trametopsis cervina]|nr:hypothetical protein BDW22DRAFT_333757 [Trametopsis cervina]